MQQGKEGLLQPLWVVRGVVKGVVTTTLQRTTNLIWNTCLIDILLRHSVQTRGTAMLTQHHSITCERATGSTCTTPHVLHSHHARPRSGEQMFPCAPIDARRRPIVELRRVCGRRRAERCQGSRAEFESRIPAFTPSPLPWHHPCPPLLQSSVAQWTEFNMRTPPHTRQHRPSTPTGRKH